jgi:hypothetical protein
MIADLGMHNNLKYICLSLCLFLTASLPIRPDIHRYVCLLVYS